ncbi:MAG TPA: ATP-dependent sacrificial sulfur transferase LarE [Acidimicrobiales bacterium]|nr:ATP-dependent sacrificial sulfur transferase LarE [Acidimicrobiales bacterium]
MSATASLAALEGELAALERVVVAFSGGADSAFLAKVAHDTLGPDRALVATAISPSLAPAEEADCRALAEEWGLRWVGVPTNEMEDPHYIANDTDRCARCKTALMEALTPIATAESATVVLGVNLDDLSDHRPGQRAASELGARFPLVNAGFDKAAVREWSRRLGLRTWDKPAAACLSSRIPYGTPVTLGSLRSIADAEAALGALGFAQLRVRHHGSVARIEVDVDALGDVLARRTEVLDAVRSAGYVYVTLDLAGFRSGSMNETLGEGDR